MPMTTIPQSSLKYVMNRQLMIEVHNTIRAKPICQILKVLSDGAKVMIYSHTTRSANRLAQFNKAKSIKNKKDKASKTQNYFVG